MTVPGAGQLGGDAENVGRLAKRRDAVASSTRYATNASRAGAPMPSVCADNCIAGILSQVGTFGLLGLAHMAGLPFWCLLWLA